jgi:hypothetical protein
VISAAAVVTTSAASSESSQAISVSSRYRPAIARGKVG